MSPPPQSLKQKLSCFIQEVLWSAPPPLRQTLTRSGWGKSACCDDSARYCRAQVEDKSRKRKPPFPCSCCSPLHTGRPWQLQGPCRDSKLLASKAKLQQGLIKCQAELRACFVRANAINVFVRLVFHASWSHKGRSRWISRQTCLVNLREAKHWLWQDSAGAENVMVNGEGTFKGDEEETAKA